MLRYISFFAVALLFNSCIVGVSGNGIVEEQNRQTEEFHSVHASGMYEIHVVQDENYRLKVVADENLMDLIVTEVKGGVLHISTRENIKKAKELDVYISAPYFDEFDLSGAVELDAKGVLESEDLKIESSGAAQIELEIEVSNLELDLSGASEVRLSGSATRVRIASSGASEMKLFDLETEQMQVNVSGASDLEINVNEDLQIEASGASEIEYRGKARISRQNLSGASSVKQK